MIGQTYTMTLEGTYLPAGLLLTGSISNGTSTISFSTFDTTPETGTYFGYHDRAQGMVNNYVGLGVAYDNFSLTVPEPGTVVLLLAGLGLPFLKFYLRRRHRRLS